jgi:hypothetical protein
MSRAAPKSMTAGLVGFFPWIE